MNTQATLSPRRPPQTIMTVPNSKGMAHRTR
nr:MAG TPA: hypothetical protein [Bacteriophage sp.]